MESPSWNIASICQSAQYDLSVRLVEHTSSSIIPDIHHIVIADGEMDGKAVC